MLSLPGAAVMEERQVSSSFLGPLDDDDDDERTRRGIWGVTQINFNAIQLIQSQ